MSMLNRFVWIVLLCGMWAPVSVATTPKQRALAALVTGAGAGVGLGAGLGVSLKELRALKKALSRDPKNGALKKRYRQALAKIGGLSAGLVVTAASVGVFLWAQRNKRNLLPNDSGSGLLGSGVSTSRNPSSDARRNDFRPGGAATGDLSASFASQENAQPTVSIPPVPPENLGILVSPTPLQSVHSASVAGVHDSESVFRPSDVASTMESLQPTASDEISSMLPMAGAGASLAAVSFASSGSTPRVGDSSFKEEWKLVPNAVVAAEAAEKISGIFRIPQESGLLVARKVISFGGVPSLSLLMAGFPQRINLEECDIDFAVYDTTGKLWGYLRWKKDRYRLMLPILPAVNFSIPLIVLDKEGESKGDTGSVIKLSDFRTMGVNLFNTNRSGLRGDTAAAQVSEDCYLAGDERRSTRILRGAFNIPSGQPFYIRWGINPQSGVPSTVLLPSNPVSCNLEQNDIVFALFGREGSQYGRFVWLKNKYKYLPCPLHEGSLLPMEVAIDGADCKFSVADLRAWGMVCGEGGVS